MTAIKKLTEQQAKRCEEAREPVCHCRCGGQLHGAKRGGGDASMTFYNGLPADDPHSAPSKEQLAAQRQEKLEARRKERRERIDAAWKKADELRIAMYQAQAESNYEVAAQLSQQFLEAHHEYEETTKAK